MEYFRLKHPPNRLILCNRATAKRSPTTWKSSSREWRTGFVRFTRAVSSMLQFCLKG
jgi:hypothetical protein